MAVVHLLWGGHVSLARNEVHSLQSTFGRSHCRPRGQCTMPDMHIHSNLACTVSAGGLHWQTGGAQQGDLHWRTGGRQVHPAAAAARCVCAHVTCHHYSDCNTSACLQYELRVLSFVRLALDWYPCCASLCHSLLMTLPVQGRRSTACATHQMVALISSCISVGKHCDSPDVYVITS